MAGGKHKGSQLAVVGILADGFTDLARALRTIDKAVWRDLRRDLKSAAELVADDARSRAGYSSRIPGSITTSVTLTGATIKAGGAAAPHAVVLEVGSSGSAHGWLRHPVFARSDEDRSEWTWVDQPTRPFLFPAFEAHQAEVLELVGEAIDRAAHAAGFH